MDAQGKRRQPTEGGLAIALLDFPKGGTFGLDGQSIVVKTDDFLGIKDVPRGVFHLVTCKNGNAAAADDTHRATSNAIDTAVTVGFLVFGDKHRGNSGGHLVRKYEPQTEEVASEERYPVDEITQRNLVQQMKDGSFSPSRVLQYDQIVSYGTSTTQVEQMFSQQHMWRELTRYIHNESSSVVNSGVSLLKDIRGLSSGVKIVPGCYDPEDETQKYDNSKRVAKENDGISLLYPPIPVVDPRLSLAKYKHQGTNRFLSRLQPQERTRLFMSATTGDDPNFVWLDWVLKHVYRDSFEALLGDLQLSYLLFLYLGCYSSLEHWKDLLAMLSLAVDGVGGGEKRERSRNRHESLYRGLLDFLPYQLSSMTDPEFLEDINEGGGNFLLPSLMRLKQFYETEVEEDSNIVKEDEEEQKEQDLLSKFRHVLSTKFPQTFPFRLSTPTGARILRNGDDSGIGNDDRNHVANANAAMDIDMTNNVFGWRHDDDDEDGPVIVSSAEIEASMTRSSSAFVIGGVSNGKATKQLRMEYPLLAAAMMPSEDVLMTCARALDEKTDVSLVREAAAYLEEVEDNRGHF